MSIRDWFASDERPPFLADDLLPCPFCKYDLRELPGDPVVCPECGTATRVEDLILIRHLPVGFEDKFETSLALSVVFFALVLITTLAGVYLSSSGLLIVGAVLVVIWLFWVFRFARSHHWRIGWLEVVAWFHASAVLWIVFIVFVIGGSEWLDQQGANGELIFFSAFLVGVWVLRKSGLGQSMPYQIGKRKLRVFVLPEALEVARGETEHDRDTATVETRLESCND